MREAPIRAPSWVNGGNRSNRASAIDALAGWANDCERKLLGLHCGQVLERSRHKAWATSAVRRCKFLMAPGDTAGAIITPWFRGES